MPGDPAVFDERPEGPALTPQNFYTALASSFPPSGLRILRRGWFSQNLSSVWRVLLLVKLSLIMLCRVCLRTTQSTYWTWFTLLLTTILTATSRIICSGCMALQTKHVSRPFPASRFQEISYLQLWCPRCCLFYQPDMRRISFSVELFSNASLQMFDLTLSMTTPQTPSPWLSVPTRSIRTKFPPSTTSILPQMTVPFWFLQFWVAFSAGSSLSSDSRGGLSPPSQSSFGCGQPEGF